MSKFLHAAAKVTAIPRVFSENSQANNKVKSNAYVITMVHKE